jgi:hypothetical protein
MYKMNKKLLIKLIITFSKTSLLSITNLTIFLQPSLAQSAAINALPAFAPTSLSKKNLISQTTPEKTPTTPQKTPIDTTIPEETPPTQGSETQNNPPIDTTIPEETPPTQGSETQNNPPIDTTIPEETPPTQDSETQKKPPTQDSETQKKPPTQDSETQKKPPTTPPENRTIPSQAGELLPEGTTRNYIGVGGNIGLSGDTALGKSAFTIFSKIALTNNFSFRPAAVLSNKAVIALPITFDFPIEPSITDFGEPQISFAPYIGGGAAISTGDNSSVGFLVTGGLDVRLSPEFTATAGVNVGFLDKTDVGLLFGIGYNF